MLKLSHRIYRQQVISFSPDNIATRRELVEHILFQKTEEHNKTETENISGPPRERETTKKLL